MRLRVSAIVFLLSCVAMHAHAQEEDVARRLQTRNVDVAKALYQNKSYTDSVAYGGSRAANVKSFLFTEHFNPKVFLTRSFFGANGYWGGNFKFNTNPADLSSRSLIPNATTPFATKTSETKTANESGRISDTHAYNTREYRGREAQNFKTFVKTPPQESSLEPMTFDQVRELLNKNK